jgi:prophage antirepressor-like protein
MEDKIVVFNNKNIRRTWHNDEWWFSVVDIIFILTGSQNSRDYWYKIKTRVNKEEKFELSTICRQLRLL